MTNSLATPVETAPDQSPCAPDSALPKHILLIEDDAEFRETIRSFLSESGYSVVTAENGVEGVRELMAGKFEVILCDVNMPKMPGDMFYRAVQGINALLCERFIFMTGYRGNDRINEFIRQVGCTVLTKPFRMARLEATITQVLAGPPAKAEPPLPPPMSHVPLKIPPPTFPAVSALPAGIAKQAVPLVLPNQMDSPAVRSFPLPAAPVEKVGPTPRDLAIRALALCAAATAVLWFWAASLRSRLQAAEGHLQYAQSEWAVVSPQLQDAELARQRIQSIIELPKRIAAERNEAFWTPALKMAVTKAGSAIELQIINARRVPAHPGACELAIQGRATGRSPRALAEQFRQSLQAEVGGQSGVDMKLHFDRLEDEPQLPSEPPTKQRASFIILGAIDAPEPPAANAPIK